MLTREVAEYGYLTLMIVPYNNQNVYPKNDDGKGVQARNSQDTFQEEMSPV